MIHRTKLFLGFLLLGLVLVAGAGWWLYAPAKLLPVTVQGARSSSGNLTISGGNLLIVAPKPSVLFGTVKAPDGKERFAYLILFQYPHAKAAGSSPDTQFQCTSDGTKAEATHAIALEGKRIEATYRIELNHDPPTVAKESLSLGGKGVDLASGQVFLIDLTGETLAYQQRNVELPAFPFKLESTQDVEQLVALIRQNLGSQDAEIKAFLR